MTVQGNGWYKDAIIYEIQIRAFADANGDGIGDFAGLTEKLDYLRDLGVTAIWLTPFYPSPMRDGGYDISDYYGVHPAYGTKDDFLRFLDAAHQRGLKVIIELVINHTSAEHPWFKRACAAAPGSEERDFYVWSDTTDRYAGARIIFKDFERSNWAWDATAQAYYWHRFYAHQPDLNFDNPSVHEALFEVVDHWMAFGVDGVRLDAIPYLYEREGTTCENLPETHAFLKKLRAHIDAKFSDRMLLAEANQWPADAASYFGTGDECHMNFHFPLMPRLFMAVHLEDSFPIVDILEQTPQIPDSCQWATFLRNHDELTLEMVTEEDRDYMYRMYAKDQRARLNLGIRRRLAPLLGDRRRLELLNAILFSLPGTPVLYYGDEIGMGDNIYLGDRDGVRTPMQWNGDRNAGFSRANPQRLYLPVIVDPHYHYAAVNVESQQADPSSLLWWMKYLIHARRSNQVFSRGSIRFLDHDNPKVLAFVREHEGVQILVAANLSRFPQHVSLVMAEYQGRQPVEMAGRTKFPRIDAERWGLSLGAYDHIWLELHTAEAVENRQQEPLVFSGSWTTIAVASQYSLAQRLASALEQKKWFRKARRQITGQHILDVIALDVEVDTTLMVVIQIDYVAAPSERFVMPMALSSGTAAQDIAQTNPRAIVTGIVELGDSGSTAGFLVDPSQTRTFAHRLLEAMRGGDVMGGETGALHFHSREGFDALLSASSLEPWGAELEQSVRFVGNSIVLKLLRPIDDGVNVEEEMLDFLASHSNRRLAPRVAGTIVWRSREGEASLVCLATELISNRGTACDLLSDALRGFLERALATPEATPEPANVFDTEPQHPAWMALAEPVPSWVDLLAHRTADLHRALSSTTDIPAFSTEPFDVLHQQSLYQSARSLVSRTFARLKRSLHELQEHDVTVATRLLSLESDVLEALQDITRVQFDVVRIRSHGDLDLGEVLFTGDDFVFIDFEGERARPMRERRYKRCALRDVAGVVRSLEVIGDATLRHGRFRPVDRALLASWIDVWTAWLAGRFVAMYVADVEGTSLVPSQPLETARLLRFYLLERCIHEIGHALDANASELHVALAGIENLLESRRA